MKHFLPLFLLPVLFSLFPRFAHADDWRDKTKLLIYSPRYFGPNAFPLPELMSCLGTRIEAEIRGEYHTYSGDKTKDLFARVMIPIVKGRAGMEVSLVILEKYKMTPETRDERFAVETESPIKCHGDVIVRSFFQVLKNDRWLDILVSANLKTASGGRLCDARYTDAAAYWFDLNVGRDLWRSVAGTAAVRMQALAGFYCWMTNDLIHRQNDAVLFGGGLTARYRNFTFSTDVTGFYGYKNNGDRPLQLRNKLNYEIKKNILSFRYNHGMKDSLYDTYSLGYIRCF